jgi:glucokinase
MNAIGVDVGGTKIAAAVVSPEGKIFKEVRYPTQAVPPNRLIETIAQAITEVKDGFEVGGVCVAVPGLILAAENKVVLAPNLHEIENIRLDEEIGRRTGLRVTVENDANAAAWGEFRYGAGKDVDHQVFITLGTGVGGGVITHGVLLRGAQGAGGELGHVTVDPTGPRCGCGNHGCLEALASGTAIRRRARDVASQRPGSALGRLAVDREVLGEDVTRLAQEGDEASILVLEQTGRWLGIGLAGFVNIFNP